MKIVLFLLGVLTASAQSLTFSPQGAVAGTRKVEVWAVSGCPVKAVSITVIYAIASQHGIPWITPKTAAEMLGKKAGWSRMVRVTGFAAAGGSALMPFDVIKAKPQIATGFVIGGALITVLLPLAQKEVPQVDSAMGQALKLGVDGCGETGFYAYPSKVTGFNEAMYR